MTRTPVTEEGGPDDTLVDNYDGRDKGVHLGTGEEAGRVEEVGLCPVP